MQSLWKNTFELWEKAEVMFENAGEKYKAFMMIKNAYQSEFFDEHMQSYQFRCYNYEFEYNRWFGDRLVTTLLYEFIQRLKNDKELKIYWYNPIYDLYRIEVNNKKIREDSKSDNEHFNEFLLDDFVKIKENYLLYDIYRDIKSNMIIVHLNENIVKIKTVLWCRYFIIRDFKSFYYYDEQLEIKEAEENLINSKELWIDGEYSLIYNRYNQWFKKYSNKIEKVILNSLKNERSLWFAALMLLIFPNCNLDVYDEGLTNYYTIINESYHKKRRVSFHSGTAILVYENTHSLEVTFDSLIWKYKSFETKATKSGYSLVFLEWWIINCKGIKLKENADSKLLSFFETYFKEGKLKNLKFQL